MLLSDRLLAGLQQTTSRHQEQNPPVSKKHDSLWPVAPDKRERAYSRHWIFAQSLITHKYFVVRNFSDILILPRRIEGIYHRSWLSTQLMAAQYHPAEPAKPRPTMKRGFQNAAIKQMMARPTQIPANARAALRVAMPQRPILTQVGYF
jgi:hypothetical protein